jgi:hypothetical protein
MNMCCDMNKASQVSIDKCLLYRSVYAVIFMLCGLLDNLRVSMNEILFALNASEFDVPISSLCPPSRLASCPSSCLPLCPSLCLPSLSTCPMRPCPACFRVNCRLSGHSFVQRFVLLVRLSFVGRPHACSFPS